MLCNDNKEEIRMKETYTSPEMEIVYFDTEDIITTSGLGEDELPVIPAGS